ncbi:MAG: DUF998 domain-containing protein [Nitrososphaerales archaeon]|nr:DUF998 domain-containing protein [Nitrososphaerales archaeon]
MSGSISTKPDNALRFLGTCGVIAPISFTVIVIILGLLNPSYSHLSQGISELGAVGAPYAIVQDANFLLTGSLIIAFAVGLQKGIGDGQGSKIGPVLLALDGGFGAVGAGIFPLPSPLHTPLSAIGVISLVIAPPFISRRLKRDFRWQSYRSYSLATGMVVVMIFLLFLFTGLFVGQDVLEPWMGVLQRMLLAPLLVWIEVMAIHLLVISNQSKVRTV